MQSKDEMPVLSVLIIGTLSGLFAGLFGVGGGFLMVPLFVLWLGMQQKRAHATSLLAVTFISTAALIPYAHLNNVSWPTASLVCIGSISGIFVGVRMLQAFSERTVSLIFSGVLAAAAVRLLISTEPHQIFHGSAGQSILILIGLISGALAGLLGVGGGIVIVPALIICSGLGPTDARGTSLVVIIVSALIGAGLHHRLGNLDHKIAVYSGTAGVPAAILGAYLSTRISNSILMPMFCALLLAMAVQLVVRNRGH